MNNLYIFNTIDIYNTFNDYEYVIRAFVQIFFLWLEFNLQISSFMDSFYWWLLCIHIKIYFVISLNIIPQTNLLLNNVSLNKWILNVQTKIMMCDFKLRSFGWSNRMVGHGSSKFYSTARNKTPLSFSHDSAEDAIFYSYQWLCSCSWWQYHGWNWEDHDNVEHCNIYFTRVKL